MKCNIFDAVNFKFSCKIIRDCIAYDQYDLSNSLTYERAFREVQTFSYIHAQLKKAREATAAAEAAKKTGGAQGVLPEEIDILKGAHKEKGDWMIMPELVEHLGSELLKEYGTQKGAGKLRELMMTRVKK